MGFMDTITRILGGFVKEGLVDYIQTETMEGDTTLVLKDGSLLSIVALGGSLDMLGTGDLEKVVSRLRISLAPYLTFPGHAIQVNFVRDPDQARMTLENLVDRTERQAGRLGLDVTDVLAERRNQLPKWLVGENCLLSIYTRPGVLSREEAKEDVRTLADKLRDQPGQATAQPLTKVFDAVYARHTSLTEALMRDLSDNGQSVELLPVDEALREIRASLYPATAAFKGDWTPRLPVKLGTGGEPARPAVPMAPDTEPELNGLDFSNLGTPMFNMQLATQDAEVLDSRTVRIGDTLFSAFDMTLAPEILLPFDNLVRALTSTTDKVSWRASFLIESGGLQAFALKQQYVTMLTVAAKTRNSRIKKALETLREVDGQEDTVVRLRMSFAAWTPDGDPAVLRRAAAVLRRAVERWGSGQTDGVSGDPLATVLSSSVGVAPMSTAPVAAAPLTDALALLPLSRQASPWKEGAVLLRTEDGKLWPFQPGSSKQTTWVDIFSGTPGSGKSVTMNALNFASALASNVSSSGNAELSRISIIDIGYSSAGLISLLQEALPADRRHEVVHRRMKMTEAFAINPLDTQLGMRRPLSAERSFMVNFLSVLFSDRGESPSSATMGLINAALDQVYELFSEHRSPRRYLPQDEPEVDRALEETGFRSARAPIWWEVVDHLMRHGRRHAAEIAQRHAIPVLADLITASQTEQIANVYAGVRHAETNENVLSMFQRVISEITRDFPVLATHTRFDIGSARIVALDLEEVTGRSGTHQAQRQTAIMYMLARHAMTRDFFLDEDEFRQAVRSGSMPKIYEDYHLQRARSSKQMPKRFCMDEYHRTGGIAGVRDQVVQDIREGRKHNNQIAIASQRLEDFDDAVLDMATSVYICNASSENAVERAVKTFGLNSVAEDVLRHELTGPTARGASMYCVFKIKGGTIRQKLFLTLGPAELWALSTTAEDAALRRLLYETVGPRAARRALATRFPSGSAKAEIETRVAKLEEEGQRLDEKARGSVIEQLSLEIQRQMFAN